MFKDQKVDGGAGKFYIVTDAIEAKNRCSLYQFANVNGCLSEFQISIIARQLLSAVNFLSSNGIVLRFLSP